MEYKYIIAEKDGNITRIKLNRPQSLNALIDDMHTEIGDALHKAKVDRECKAVLLSGEGRAFCAGADIKVVQKFNTPFDYWERRKWYQDEWRAFAYFGKPLVAAMQGYTLGGGVELALLCDIRIAAENAVFGFPEPGLGLMATEASAQKLAHVVGVGAAKEMLFTTNRIDAKEALRIGLVNKVVPLGELDKTATEMARKIAGNSPVAVTFLKTMVDHAFDMSAEAMIELELAHCWSLYAVKPREEVHAKAREELGKK